MMSEIWPNLKSLSICELERVCLVLLLLLLLLSPLKGMKQRRHTTPQFEKGTSRNWDDPLILILIHEQCSLNIDEEDIYCGCWIPHSYVFHTSAQRQAWMNSLAPPNHINLALLEPHNISVFYKETWPRNKRSSPKWTLQIQKERNLDLRDTAHVDLGHNVGHSALQPSQGRQRVMGRSGWGVVGRW